MGVPVVPRRGITSSLCVEHGSSAVGMSRCRNLLAREVDRVASRDQLGLHCVEALQRFGREPLQSVAMQHFSVQGIVGRPVLGGL